MAKQNTSNRSGGFVDQVVKDPNNPPNALLLQGYLGASSEENHVRLYLDPQLSDYVEIPEDAVLHTVDTSAEQSPLGGSYVWINADAQLTHGKAGGDRPKAKFLEGRIQQQFQGGAAAQPGGQALVSAQPCSGIQTQCCPPTAQHPCSGIHTACCLITQPVGHCSGVFTQCCPGPLTAPPHCSGIHTACCPLTAPPHCSGIHTQCCPVTAQQPCSGIHTACCPPPA